MKMMNPRLVRLARRLDPIWKLVSLMRARRPPRSGSEPGTILIVDLHLVGDIVMLLPLVRAMRTRFPATRIALVAGPWARPILEGSPEVDDVIEYVAPWVKPMRMSDAVAGYIRLAWRLHSTRWDLAIDVRGDVRQILLLFLAGCHRRVGFDFTGGGALLTDIVADDGSYAHILDHHERLAAHVSAWDGRPFVPAAVLTEAERHEAARIVPYIGFHFGASLELRRLPIASAAELLLLHADSPSPLVVFSPPDLDDYLSELQSQLPASLLDRLEFWRGGLRSFLVKASRAEALFVMDSGPAHIAASLGRKTIVFFGPNLPRYTGPRGPSVQFVEDVSVPCRPCDQHHCINPVRQACMKGLVGPGLLGSGLS